MVANGQPGCCPARWCACWGGLGILMGLGSVSNLEMSLETPWQPPGVSPGPGSASSRFLEDDIFCNLFFFLISCILSLFSSNRLGCSLCSLVMASSLVTFAVVVLSTMLLRSPWLTLTAVKPSWVGGVLVWAVVGPGVDGGVAGHSREPSFFTHWHLSLPFRNHLLLPQCRAPWLLP